MEKPFVNRILKLDVPKHDLLILLFWFLRSKSQVFIEFIWNIGQFLPKIIVLLNTRVFLEQTATVWQLWGNAAVSGERRGQVGEMQYAQFGERRQLHRFVVVYRLQSRIRHHSSSLHCFQSFRRWCQFLDHFFVYLFQRIRNVYNIYVWGSLIRSPMRNLLLHAVLKINF